MIELLNIIIFLPLATGIILFLLPDRLRLWKGSASLAVTVVFLIAAVKTFCSEDIMIPLAGLTNEALINISMGQATNLEEFTMLSINALSKLILLFMTVLAVIINLYSIYRENNPFFPKHFYSWFLISLGCSAGTVMSDNLLLLLFFWGILGFTLYKLIAQKDEKSSAAAKKTLILIGSSDALMIMGIGLIWNIAGTLNISELYIQTSGGPATIAFILLAIGSFTKAGAFPFHTWIVNFTEKAHGISSAFMPASFDKLIGIYLLAVLCSQIFELNQWLVLILLIIGVCTIIFAVMMALVQHNYKKLLGYHAISQVGYMVLGISLGSPLGIAAGLFHMLNNAVYKSGLFLSATTIEKKTGTDNLDQTGGLASSMPLSFITALIFALSISGIPPLNGFASKWMIYQGIVEFGQQPGIASQLWIIWLSLAVFGSALTLASFIKFISGIYLGQKKEIYSKVNEVSFIQWIPKVLLALICVLFGAFATNILVKELFMPVSGEFAFTGIWDSSLLFWLVVASVIAGFLIYRIGNLKNMRRVEPFVGGEKAGKEHGFPVTGFYSTLSSMRFLAFFYERAERKWFDIYELTKGFVFWTSKGFSYIHNGLLTSYAFWIYAGLAVIILFLIL